MRRTHQAGLPFSEPTARGIAVGVKNENSFRMIKWGSVGALLALMTVLVLGWSDFEEAGSEDPFENAFVVATAPSFKRQHVPGTVIKYVSPAYFDVMPDIDWGERSVYLETDLPLERDLYGGIDDKLTVRCAEVAFASVDGKETLPGPVGWPPDALFAVARADPDTKLHMRRCQIQIGPKDRAAYDFSGLIQRCEDAVRERMAGAGVVRDDDNRSLQIRNVEPVPLPHGTLVEANCLVHRHQRHLYFETWVLTGRRE